MGWFYKVNMATVGSPYLQEVHPKIASGFLRPLILPNS